MTTIPAIRVTRELYDGSDRDSRRNRMAFSISFPDGTGCWSHNTANVAARISEYRAVAKRPVDVDWRISDIPCPVQVDGTIAKAEGATDDTYRVLPHRDVLDCTMYSARTGQPVGGRFDYEHVPCGMPLTRQDIVEANWCPHCTAAINKAAAARGKAARGG